MMELDRQKRLYDLMTKQALHRELPKIRRKRQEFLKHCEECPSCNARFQAHMRALEAENVDRRKAMMPDPREVLSGLFSSLGVKSHE